MYPKFVSGATSMPQEAVDYLGCLISYVRIYTYEKREVRLFFTLNEGFAIPVLSRKTTEVHARYA